VPSDRSQRGGRPWASLKAGPAAVHELAKWLRDRITVSGQTLATLATAIPYSRMTISRKLDGSSCPEWEFVERLVVATAGLDPRARDALTGRARELWRAAHQATGATLVTVVASSTSVQPTVEDLFAKLHEAERRRAEALQSVQMQQQLVSGLLLLTNSLSTALAQQRIAASTASETSPEQSRLATTEHHERHAREMLDQAERQVERARRLLATAERQYQQVVDRLAHAGERVEATDPDHISAAGPSAELVRTIDPDAAGRVLARAELLITDSGAELDALEQELTDADQQPGPPSQVDRPSRRPTRSIVFASLAAVVVLASAAIVLVDRPWRTSTPTPEAASPAPSPTLVTMVSPTASVASNSTGVACPDARGGRVVVQRAYAVDGGTGISSSIRVVVRIDTPPADQHTYWLLAQFSNGNGHDVYNAKTQLSGQPGWYEIPFSISSPVGSVRQVYVVDGAPAAIDWLQQNNRNSNSGAWDANRLALAAGARVVSNSCPIKRTRT
jgi:hypothetical protein